MLDNIKMYLSYFSETLFFRVQLIRTLSDFGQTQLLRCRCERIESKSVLARVNITPYFIDGLQWKAWLIVTCGFRNRFTTVKD